MTSPQYTCLECGYDMHDRQGGDPCPECNTPLDTRPGISGSNRAASIKITILIVAFFMMPFFALISFIGLFTAIYPSYPSYPQKSLESHYRISQKVTQKRRLIRILVWLCFAEFAALMVISLIWTDALNWW